MGGTPETLRAKLSKAIKDELLCNEGVQWSSLDERVDYRAGVALIVFRDWLREIAVDVRARPPMTAGTVRDAAYLNFFVEQLAHYVEFVLAGSIDEELNTDGR